MGDHVVQTLKLREGEISVDLDEFLPPGQRRWFPNQVNTIKGELTRRMSIDRIDIRHECPYQSSSLYSTLYIPWSGEEATLRRTVRGVVDGVVRQLKLDSAT